MTAHDAQQQQAAAASIILSIFSRCARCNRWLPCRWICPWRCPHSFLKLKRIYFTKHTGHIIYVTGLYSFCIFSVAGKVVQPTQEYLIVLVERIYIYDQAVITWQMLDFHFVICLWHHIGESDIISRNGVVEIKSTSPTSVLADNIYIYILKATGLSGVIQPSSCFCPKCHRTHLWSF